MTPIAAITLAVSSAEAQYIRFSTWDTSYGQEGAGPPTYARLRFQGSEGSYLTGGGTGQLSSVCYDLGLGGRTLVSGCWSLSGNQGWFAFTVGADGLRFKGFWGIGASGGPVWGHWNGTRASVPAPVPDPVAVSAPGP